MALGGKDWPQGLHQVHPGAHPGDEGVHQKGQGHASKEKGATSQFQISFRVSLSICIQAQHVVSLSLCEHGHELGR